ncbi:hypothetical protein C8J57DRAFT_1521240 [Mycena rebaudengoi]|nr:hypothetical protein C8J57DRAFT_1521240 [Mycena rebaudengoi]
MSSFQQEKTKDEQVAQTPDESQKKEGSPSTSTQNSCIGQLGRQYRAPTHLASGQTNNTDGEAVKHFWSHVDKTMDAGDRQPMLEDFWFHNLRCAYLCRAAHTSILPASSVSTRCPPLPSNAIRPRNSCFVRQRVAPCLPSNAIPPGNLASNPIPPRNPLPWTSVHSIYSSVPAFCPLPPQKMSHNAEELDAEEQCLFAAAVLEIATVQLAWQRDFVKLWGELGKAPRADDPTLDTYTRDLILAGIAVDEAWNHALDYCHPQALAALAIAIQLDPAPPGDDHPPYLVPLDFDLVAHAADTADLLLPPIANANANACHQ